MDSNILIQLPFDDKVIPVGSLLRELTAARQFLTQQRQAQRVAVDQATETLNDIDGAIATVMKTQELIGALIDAFPGLDLDAACEAAADD